jgi:hypothetical protein
MMTAILVRFAHASAPASARAAAFGDAHLGRIGRN